MLTSKTTRGIERVNEYEQKLKIKTNANKFKLISISRYALNTVTVDGNVITFANRMAVLGLTGPQPILVKNHIIVLFEVKSHEY